MSVLCSDDRQVNVGLNLSSTTLRLYGGMEAGQHDLRNDAAVPIEYSGRCYRAKPASRGDSYYLFNANLKHRQIFLSGLIGSLRTAPDV